MNSKIDKRIEKIHQRLSEIEAAVSDVSPSSFGVKKVKELEAGGMIERQYKNRLQSVFILLYHLLDDVRRLAKVKNVRKFTVDEFLKKSLWVNLCIRAGNTHKHGLGGRSKNGTLLNGLIYVVKVEPSKQQTPDSDALLVGMFVADADYGTFPSQKLIEGALVDWGLFLADVLDVDISNWLNRCLPNKGEEVALTQGQHIEVPLGTTLIFELPESMRDIAQKNANKQRNEA